MFWKLLKIRTDGSQMKNISTIARFCILTIHLILSSLSIEAFALIWRIHIFTYYYDIILTFKHLACHLCLIYLVCCIACQLKTHRLTKWLKSISFHSLASDSRLEFYLHIKVLKGFAFLLYYSSLNLLFYNVP